MKRVVITGLGIVSPLGHSISSFWSGLMSGRSAIRPLLHPSSTTTSATNKHRSWNDKIPIKVAASIDREQFTAQYLVPYLQSPHCHKDIVQSRLTPFIQYALVASQQALLDASWDPRRGIIGPSSHRNNRNSRSHDSIDASSTQATHTTTASVQTTTSKDEKQRRRNELNTGVIIGSGMCDMDEITTVHDQLSSDQYRRINPLFIPRMLINMPSGYVSIQHGLKGPNACVSTACATGAHAIADAYRHIQFGDARVMVAGGTESCLNAVCFSGFARLRALSLGSDEMASSPFDAHRSGFVMGEGAGVIVLEEYEHAVERGARIYCEMTGYGLSGDAYHITSPSPDGEAATAVMKRAVAGDVMAPDNHPAFATVDYVNAHATSTKVGDRIEMNSIMKLFGGAGVSDGCGDDGSNASVTNNSRLRVSSIKGSIGHLLGAAGAVEAIATILSVYHNQIPVTRNLHHLDDDVHGDEHWRRVFMVGEQHGQSHEVRTAVTNSFGFGGTNTSLCFKKLQ